MFVDLGIKEILLISPEIILAAAAMLILLVGAFVKSSLKYIDVIVIALLIYLTYYMIKVPQTYSGSAFNGMYVSNEFAHFIKILVIISVILILLIKAGYARIINQYSTEFTVLTLLSVVGIFIMISSRDLLLLYLGIELQSLVLYILASSNRDCLKSSEAGLKYFIVGALASAIMLFGMSFVYGFAGTLNYQNLRYLYSEEGLILLNAPAGFTIGVVMIMVGLFFKVAAAPFHMWAPDVYEGSPIIATLLFATVTKISLVAVLLELLFIAFYSEDHKLEDIVQIVAVISVLFGALGAIMQQNLKRIIAYSGILNIGIVMISFGVGTILSLQAAIIYMTLYVIAVIGFFGILIATLGPDSDNATIQDLAGIGKTKKISAILLALVLFSMIGIPPLAGFFGKFYVFVAAVEAGYYKLAIIGLVGSVVASYYYLNIIKAIYFQKPEKSIARVAIPLELVLVIFVTMTIVICFFIAPNALLSWIKSVILNTRLIVN